MPRIQPVTTAGLDDTNRQRRHREVTDLMLNFQHDDSRVRTPAEVAAGVRPINHAYPPGDARRYGAAIDNSTDDTKALTNAIAQAAETGGAEVTIPVIGTMLISSPVAILANVVIRGLGRELTTIKVKGGTGDTCNPLLYAKQVDGWHISDLKLDGNAANLTQSVGHSLLYISGCSDWSVERCHFRDCGKTTASPSGAHLFITAYETADPTTITAFDVRNVPSKRWRVKDCHFSDPSAKCTFGLRPYSNFDYDIVDSSFTVFVQDGLVSGCTFEGFDWNPVELAGPAVRNNHVVDCTVYNSHGFGGFEADKGASYNVFRNCTVRDAIIDRIDTWGFRSQGYPVGSVSVARYATGNLFDGCRVQTLTGTASFNVGGIWANLAKETMIVGLQADSVTGTTSDESAVTRIEEADDTIIHGGIWKSVHRGLYLGVNVNRLRVIGVLSDTDYRFLDITGSGTRTGIALTGCDLNVSSANIICNVSQMELTAVGNTLRGSSATAFNLVNNGATGFIGDNRLGGVGTRFAGTLPIGLRLREQVSLTTTDATSTSALALTVADESAIQVEAKIVGRKSDTSDRAMYHHEALIYRDGGGSATIQTALQKLYADIETTASWAAAIAVTGNDVQVNVVGVAATTISWAVEFDAQAI